MRFVNQNNIKKNFLVGNISYKYLNNIFAHTHTSAYLPFLWNFNKLKFFRN